MARFEIRMSDEQKFHLDTLSAKTGYNASEIVRNLIDNCDEVTLTLALKKIDENKKIEIEKVASLKYKTFLLSNISKNINQIAHYVNANKNNNVSVKLEKYLSEMLQIMNEIKVKLDGNNKDDNV